MARIATRRQPLGTGLLALALAASTSVATLGAVPGVTAPASPELSRVVVSAASAGAHGVATAAAAVAAAGGTVLHRLPLVGGVSAELPRDAVLTPGLSVVPDRPIELAQSAGAAAAAPASTVRATLGLGAPAGEGAGVTIAVVDTGVAPHPDLAGRLTSVDVSGAGAGDGYGHGTFVAGVAAGSGASSGDHRYAGVAPGAQVLDVRVADDDGSTDLVTVLRGLEVAHSGGADVVNLSLSSYSPLPWQVDPLTVALTRLWMAGTVVVVPAGNDGPDAASITSPGTAPALLTVGALDQAGTADRADDTVADFSARGPAPQGVAKPELVAPGRSVVSLRATGSTIDREHAVTGAVDDSYFRGSGTSFSTAATAGAAATLLGDRALSPDQVKAVLVQTAYRPNGLLDASAAGAGGLALDAARSAPAPDVSPGCSTNKGPGSCGPDGPEMPVPGAPGHWKQLVRALAAGDAAAAASSWSRLSPEAKGWVASSWSGLPADLRDALAADWTGRTWAGGSAQDWAAREWAGRTWAASSWSGRTWADDEWAGRTWAGRTWAASSWSGRTWAGRTWAGRTWADDEWAGRTWAGRTWAGRTWAGSWTGRTWAAADWS